MNLKTPPIQTQNLSINPANSQQAVLISLCLTLFHIHGQKNDEMLDIRPISLKVQTKLFDDQLIGLINPCARILREERIFHRISISF